MTRVLLLTLTLLGCQSREASTWREVRFGDVVAIVNEPVNEHELVRFDTVAYAGRFDRVGRCLRLSMDEGVFTPAFTNSALARRAVEIAEAPEPATRPVGGDVIGGEVFEAVAAAGRSCPEPYFLISELPS